MPTEKYRDNKAAFFFLLPCMLGFLVFVAFPVVSSLLLSFTEWNFLGGFEAIKWVGIDNFSFLLGGKDIWFNAAIRNTLVFSAITVPVGLALGLVVAAMIGRHVYFSNIFKTIVFIPYISSIVASVIVWQVMLQPSYGPVNTMLRAIGVQNPPKWFVDPNWALTTLMIFQVWQTLGYNVVVFLSGLKGISPELYEAASIDGANNRTQFFMVTLPMISSVIFFNFIMGIIGSLQTFAQVFVVTEGGPNNASMMIVPYLFDNAFRYYRMGYASAIAWVLFVIILIFSIMIFKSSALWVYYEEGNKNE